MGADRASQSGSKPGKAARRAVSGSGFGGQKVAPGRISFRECDKLGRVLDSITAAGDALIVARTSDGGAVVLTLLTDNGRDKAYAGTQAELDSRIDWLYGEYCDPE